MPGRPQFKIDRDRARRHASKQERDLQAQKAASSRPGQVYHTMTSVADRMTRPGYQNNQADINQLKSLRRDWNRNQKYTPQGMQVSGATTPMGAQDAYVGMSRDLRQSNKPAYNKMYPLTGGFMDIMDKGGIWGAMLSGLAKKGLKKADPLSHVAGIGSNVSDLGKGFWGDLKQMGSDIFGGIGIGGSVPRDEATEEVLKNYSEKTFGPPLGAVDVTGDPTRRRDVGYDITASDLDVAPMPPADYGDLEYFDWVDKYYDTHNPDGTPKSDPTVIPGVGTSYVDDFADVVGEEVPPALPPYEGREFGLGQFINEMPTSRKSDWEDYLEYVQRLGDMEAGYHKQKLTYDEWHNMMRRRR